jgi:hypothetical protein
MIAGELTEKNMTNDTSVRKGVKPPILNQMIKQEVKTTAPTTPMTPPTASVVTVMAGYDVGKLAWKVLESKASNICCIPPISLQRRVYIYREVPRYLDQPSLYLRFSSSRYVKRS